MFHDPFSPYDDPHQEVIRPRGNRKCDRCGIILLDDEVAENFRRFWSGGARTWACHECDDAQAGDGRREGGKELAP